MAFWRFIKKIFRGLRGKKKPVKRKARKSLSPKRKKTKAKRPVLRKAKRFTEKKSAKPRKKLKSRKIKKKTKVKALAKTALKEVGVVTHYFDRISVAVLKVSGPLKIGDSIRFAARQGDFVQMVISMQINRKDILKAPKGSEIGLKTLRPVSEGDKVFMAVES